ncbi:MAG: MFS transporter, partial [Spirochaetales bacterium]|nr:MFS transporter [Spirochaetales bacterium]
MLRKRYRFLIILGAVLMQVSIGAIYSWTLFNEPLHEKFGWDYSSILLTYSLTIFVFAFTTLFSGRLLDKYGPRKIGIIGGILYGVGVILTSRATSIYQLYLFYGVIAGIGVGFVYV